MWLSWLRHVSLDHKPWNVLLSVSMPNQLIPVSRTFAPVASMIWSPRVLRYPVPVPAAKAELLPDRAIARAVLATATAVTAAAVRLRLAIASPLWTVTLVRAPYAARRGVHASK